MRIYTHPLGRHYANAIYGQDESLAGQVYQLQAGTDTIDILFQAGPIDSGTAGLINEQLLAVLTHRLKVLQLKAPCVENTHAIAHLEAAMTALSLRENRLHPAEAA